MLSRRRAAFVELPAVISKTGLRIGERLMIETWEQDLQRTLVKRAVRRNDRVLEIGYGLGFAAAEICSHDPAYHLIVEAHPDVIEFAGATYSPAADFRIINDFWQNLVPPASSEKFHSAVFDPYPIEMPRPFDGSVAMTVEFALEFLREADKWLLDGGRCGFIDFSCALATKADFQKFLLDRLFAFDFFPVELKKVRSTYARCSSAHVVVVTI